ncbi:hypothetical protein O7606_25685 [Micromonospora sp. WMMD882]|nr:hypothetical protein [Micromonospora sp. WMMD882]WBB79504.1 hypothetical protein O7606_25685 [Micromonospora sp. WMMD882]
MRQHEQTDQTDVIRSEPVPVPPPNGVDGRHADRAGRTEVPEDAIDDRGTFDDPAAPDGRRWEDRSDDRGEVVPPAPVPTAFGATTVGGAVAASALANPVPADEPDPREERTARPGDGAVDGDLRDADADLRDRDGDSDRDPRTGAADRVGRDADPTALLHGHHRAQTTDEAEAAAPGGPGYGSPTPTMVDPDSAAEATRTTDPELTPTTDPAARRSAGAETLTAAGTTGSSSAELAEPATLFDPSTAEGFRDRWRDVQLRFVDDPKAAAGQAQALVEEAIHALAAALAEQKNRISGWQDAGSADTEQLRQAVRGYRDFLDRVLGR